jgi:hypothetical protein
MATKSNPINTVKLVDYETSSDEELDSEEQLGDSDSKTQKTSKEKIAEAEALPKKQPLSHGPSSRLRDSGIELLSSTKSNPESTAQTPPQTPLSLKKQSSFHPRDQPSISPVFSNYSSPSYMTPNSAFSSPHQPTAFSWSPVSSSPQYPEYSTSDLHKGHYILYTGLVPGGPFYYNGSQPLLPGKYFYIEAQYYVNYTPPTQSQPSFYHTPAPQHPLPSRTASSSQGAQSAPTNHVKRKSLSEEAVSSSQAAAAAQSASVNIRFKYRRDWNLEVGGEYDHHDSKELEKSDIEELIQEIARDTSNSDPSHVKFIQDIQTSDGKIFVEKGLHQIEVGSKNAEIRHITVRPQKSNKTYHLYFRKAEEKIVKAEKEKGKFEQKLKHTSQKVHNWMLKSLEPSKKERWVLYKITYK